MDNYLFSKGNYYSLSFFQMFVTERERTAVFRLANKNINLPAATWGQNEVHNFTQI